MSIEDRLKQLMREQGIETYEELARLTGVHQGTIRDIRRGKREARLGTFEALSEALHVTPWWLIWGVGGKNEQS